MSHSAQKQNTLALAALFQAGLLADEIATKGVRRATTMRPLLEGILLLNTNSVNQVYPDKLALEPGLRLIRDALTGQYRDENFRQVAHALALIQLARVAGRDHQVLTRLRNQLETLVTQREHFVDLTSNEFCHRAAGIYTSTLSTLKYRIQVQGDPTILRNEDNSAAIRALFLAGVRAAFLWHQNGGRRWQLLVHRRRFINDVDTLLM